MGRLNGKVAIVTGAAQGQGEAEARLFALEGAKVTMVDIKDTVLATGETIRKLGGDVLPLVFDISVRESWKAIVNKTLERYGKIDILMNNAGIAAPNYIDDLDRKVWDRVLEVQLWGPIYGMNAVIPEMRKVGGGSIINCSSLSAFTAMSGDNAYCAAKSAITGLSRAAALKYAPDKIRVNTVVPGIIDTPMTAFICQNPEHPLYAHWKSKMRLGRFGTPEDMAYAVLYLASDESSHVTGINLPVDGGWMLD